MFQSASMPKSVKLKLKGGGYVDPDSGLDDKVREDTQKNKWYLMVGTLRKGGGGVKYDPLIVRGGGVELDMSWGLHMYSSKPILSES